MAYSPPPGQQNHGPQQPYPPYQGPYPHYPPAPPTNGLAIASLVCGVGAFVIGLSFIPAIICGHIARGQIRRTGERGGGMPSRASSSATSAAPCSSSWYWRW